MRRGWAKYAVERLAMLRRWRELAFIVAGACREVLGDGCMEVYVVGGAAEGRLTVLSDIDVVVIARDPPRGPELLDLVERVMVRAFEKGLPDDAPIDLKIMGRREFEELKGRIYRKTVKIEFPRPHDS
ncbi:MAG: nucleotidyltransferase domain-containing protein [Desulfurococcales archaeon]|nr:nucleotidyltransferase domain-containing protein [Desulfurococcales archaeon]